jgi:alpha-L-fucosidase
MIHFLKISVVSFCLLLSSSVYAADGNGIVCPNKLQQQWADAEIGVLFHFDMPTFKEDYEWRNFGSHPDPSVFNPSDLNTDQWLEAAKRLGAKYAILVAKHCSGFSLWPTDAHPYSVKSSSWMNGKGDVVKNFIASCHKYGIRPGIYASTSANGYLHVDNLKVQPGGPVTQDEYNKIVIKQLTELWSNYGQLFEVWFDGGLLAIDKGGADVFSLLKRLQPNAIAFQGPFGYDNLIRWVGNEEGAAPYPCWATADSTTNANGCVTIEGLNGRAGAPYWCPGESDCTLRLKSSYQGGWFWHKNQDNQLYQMDELMKRYVTSVGRNTNMLLGIVIDDRGLVPDADMKLITSYGNEIKRQFSHPYASKSGSGYRIDMKFKKAVSIDRAVVQEEISKGERILSYRIIGLKGGKWIQLSTGNNIGHKHIDVFKPQKLTSLRLIIDKAKATPLIKTFAAFSSLHQ